MKIKKNAVLITGASSGIGKAIATEFVKNNIFVIGTARRLNLLKQFKQQLGERKKNFEARQLDIEDKNSVIRFSKSISSKYYVDCLINSAGLTSFKKAEDDSVDEIEKIIKVNLLGTIYTIKSILPEMIKRKQGTIINILSMVTKKIFLGSSIYSASKSGLMAYTNVLREEVRNKNIRIINIPPGATETFIWPRKILKKYHSRMMNVQNIAELVYKLYSEKSNMVVEDVAVRPIKGDL